MATAEGILTFSVESIVEDVLKKHGKRLSDIDLASRKAEEASLRRYEAAGWLRKTVGVVGSKDLPAEPSEEDFRLGLRSGIILCNALNKVQPGAVPKVVEALSDSVIISDGAALSAYQYFENVRNFLVAVEEMGLPTFEASDLEQGGKSSRIVNCVLALRSYNDWKQGGGIGSWKFGGNLKPGYAKQFGRKNSEPFTGSLRILSGEKSPDSLLGEQSSSSDLGNDLYEMGSSHSLHILVRELLLDKKPEHIPIVVENMLGKIMEEFENRLANQNVERDVDVSGLNKSSPKTSCGELEMEDNRLNTKIQEDECSNKEDIRDDESDGPVLNEQMLVEQKNGMFKMEDNRVDTKISEEECWNKEDIQCDESKSLILKQQMFVEQQNRDVQELKRTLHSAKAEMQFLQMKYQEEVKNLGIHLHGLAYAASGYQRVLEENRKLYNQVQDLKGNIRVYCRVRPFLPGQPNRASTVDHIDEASITIVTPVKYAKDGRKSFTFNRVFAPSATQEKVFSDTQPLIRSVLDGYNVCIFAYGQTGSGKTYTMTGPNDLTPETFGVNYRALNDLFLISEQRKHTISYEVSVQMIEIYNEQVRDLLASEGLNRRLEIRNSSQNGVNVPDANLVPVSSTSDVINLMNLGHKNRAVSSTAMNDRSSRSHSCLMVHVQGREMTSGAIVRGCMHLVDLAGSERVDKSEVVGDRLKEAQHINKSLAALGDVISSLAQKNSHVPYRNSKLTQLLQDSLGGQAKTLMFVHISPELDAVGETISTLKFAERVSTIELGAARINKDSADVKELKDQIASLKEALAKKDGEPRYVSSTLSSPDLRRMKSPGCSPLHPNWHSGGDDPASRKQSLEDVANLEVRKNSAAKLRKESTESQDSLMSSPPWRSGSSPATKEDEKEAGYGDWVDKVVVNKQVDLDSDENQSGPWEEDNSQLSEMFYQRHEPGPLRRKEGQDNGVHRSKFETASTDDSDLEAATSDSSETDLLWQLNPPKVSNTTNISNGLGSKLKRPSKKHVKNIERSSIPSPAAPRRSLSGSLPSPLHKTGRQPVPADGKRKAGSGK